MFNRNKKNTDMKRLVFVVLMLFAVTLGYSQEKGFHLTLGGGLGLQSFDYDIGEDGNVGSKMGYSAGLGLQYYFTQNMGVGVGLGFSRYNTSSTFDETMFSYSGLTDDYDGLEYTSNIRLRNWRENQTTYFLDIPVMFMWQQKFDKKETFGIYFGAGLKFQVPIESTYQVKKGVLNLSAYFPEYGIDFGEEINIDSKGLGNSAVRPSGDNNLKLGMSLAGEFGFLIALSPRVDLMLGVSADYGLLNIKKKSDDVLATPIQGATTGDRINYNGVLNSKEIESIHPFSVKGNVGIKIKLGKMRDRKLEEEEAEVEAAERRGRWGRDTIIINPIIEIPPIVLPEIYTQGIPAAAVPVTAIDMDTILGPIYFDLNQYTLTDESKHILDRKATLLKKYPHVDLLILGNTCDLGSGKLNDDLGFNRANAAKFYLIRRGIKASRITVISEGMHHPDAPNTDEPHRRLNRRADFILAE